MANLVALAFGVADAGSVNLSDPTGADERAARGDAQALLARVADVDVEALTVGDRDRALAALYTQVYGGAVRADTSCVQCAARFEMRFDLRALVQGRAPDGQAEGNPPAIRVGSSVLRLPCVRDLRAPSADALVDMLHMSGPKPSVAEASEALAAADPALELDLAGSCPDCGASQSSPFSMARFFGAALQQDLVVLMREIHVLATRYGWSFDEILGLTRTERRMLYGFVVADLEGTKSGIGRVA